MGAADAHHIADVLRLRPGDRVALVHGGCVYEAALQAVRSDAVEAGILRLLHDDGGELPAEVTVLQALLKGSKFDEVVEKVVELGAARIVPVRCERSFTRVGSSGKCMRWRRIAQAAGQQSRRRILPQVDDVCSLSEALQRYALGEPLFVAFESAPLGSLAAALRNYKAPGRLAIAAGPEGSFSPPEIALALHRDAHIVSLGPTILRAQSAAPALLAAIAAHNGWW